MMHSPAGSGLTAARFSNASGGALCGGGGGVVLRAAASSFGRWPARLVLAVGTVLAAAALLLTSGDPLEFAEAQTDQSGSVTFSADQPQQGVPLTATLSDPDGSVTSQVWQWASSDTASGTFTDISGATSASYTPVASDVGKYLRASVSYTDALGSGKSASEVTANAVGVVPVTVSINADSTRVAESGASTSTTLTVELNRAPRRTVVIPIEASGSGGATSADYTLSAASVTFNATETRKTLTFRVVQDTDEDAGESVVISIGDLPDGVTIVSLGGAQTITIIDDDPAVTVSFKESAGEGFEGDSVTVTVELSEDPHRRVRIPITMTGLSGAIAPGTPDPADFEVSATEVVFTSGVTSQEFTVTINQDTTPDDGEGVRFGFGTISSPGVSASGTTTMTVRFKDDDPAVTVEFDETAYSVEEGNRVTVTVTLSEDPQRSVVIPITAAGGGGATAPGGMDTADYTAPPDSVTFTSGQTSRSFSFTITEDTTPDHGESVGLGFGSDLPPGVSEGTDNQSTVMIVDDDPTVTVAFSAAAYTVDEADTVTIDVTLSADPQRPLSIPITASGLRGATAADWESPPNATVASGSLTGSLTFTPVDDDLDDDNEQVRLSFGAALPPGVTKAGTQDTTTVSITDDDDPEVKVEFKSATYSVRELNGGSVTVEVVLDADPERTVVIPLDTAISEPDWGGTDFATGPPSSVTFDGGERSQSFTVSVSDNFVDDDPTTATITFGALPDRVSAGTKQQTVISVTDDETRGIVMTSTSATVTEAGTASYTISLKTRPTDDVTINVAPPSGNTDASASPSSITLDASNWTTGETITITATDDSLDENRETVTFTNTLTSTGDYGVNNVTVSDFVLTITDDDSTPVITGPTMKNFPEIEYDADSTMIDLDVATYSATDADAGDTITWSLSGADASKFELTAQTNGDRVLSFKGDEFGDNNGPDFENPLAAGNTNAYKVTVNASDGTNTATRAVTVAVTAVNETPTISSFAVMFLSQTPNMRTISEIAHDADASLTGSYIDDLLATDEEDQAISWSLAGPDAGSFDISEGLAPGWKRFATSSRFDHERPVDQGKDNVYNFIVQASDGENTATHPFTITVVNINEAPIITDPPAAVIRYKENEYDYTGALPSLFRPTATDPEGHTFHFTTANSPRHDEGVFDFFEDGLFFISDTDSTNVVKADFENRRDQDKDNIYVVEFFAQEDSDQEGQAGGVIERTKLFTVRIEIVDVNEKPEFIDTPETAIDWDENQQASEEIHDYNARDEEGAVDFSLSGADRGDFDLSTDGKLTFKQAPNFEDAKDADKDSVYEVSIVATDRESGTTRRSTSLDVTVTVNDLEEAGAVSINSLNPGVGDILRFALSDPDGLPDDTVYNWYPENCSTQCTVESNWSTVSGITSSPTSASTYNYTIREADTGKQLRARVEYSDRRSTTQDLPSTLTINEAQDKEATSDDTMPVTADPIVNAPPRFTRTFSFTIAEGEAGRNVGTPLTTSDRDGDSLRFGIDTSIDNDHALFEIDATSGQLRLAEEVDFETVPAIGFLQVTVTLHDREDEAGNSESSPTIDATTTVSVFVTDVEEDGVVTFSADEPETGVAITAMVEDDDGTVSGEEWEWARSANGRTGWSTIGGADSATYTPVEADEDFYLRARVTYTDDRGSGKIAEGITDAPVPSINRRPLFPDSEDGVRTIAENTRRSANIGSPIAAVDPDNDRLTYTLSGADADIFTIVSSSGQIRVKDELDFESPASADTSNEYRLTVSVHDGRDSEGEPSTTIDSSQDVTISVTNVNEPGTVALSTDTGVVQARVETTAALTDPDGSVGDLTWQWSQSANGRTNWANIGGATSDRFTPADTLVGRYIRATATYSDQLSGAGNATQTASAVSARVAGPPPVNSPPVFPASAREREVEENAAGGTDVGAPVAATDLNAGDAAVNAPLVYSLGGTDAALFAIDAATGQLSLAATVQAGDLDYETKRTYRVTVEVTDGHDELGDDEPVDVIDARRNVTINVTDVNEAPEVTGQAAASVEENINRAIETYTATDPERDVLTWSVDDTANFWVSARGELWYASPPSFEDGATARQVTVTATDPDGLTDSQQVTVTVTDVEEEGVASITPHRGWVDTDFRAGLTDGDGGVSNQTWQWSRSTNRSTWTDIGGATSASYTAVAGDVGHYLRVRTEYTDRRGSGKTAEALLSVRIAGSADRPAANQAPAFDEATTTRAIGQGPRAGRPIGAAVRATDPDRDDILFYSLLAGQDADKFEIDPATGQLRTKAVLDPGTYTVTVSVHDGFDPSYGPSISDDASIEVTITVTAVAQLAVGAFGGGGGGGGGGGAPAVAVPSEADFDWNVRRDIDALDREQEEPTGLWSDGETLYVLNNASGGQDRVFAYALETGERRAEREFELERRNRFAHGLWSDGETVWVADSGQDRLFAYRLQTGERLEAREFALHERNRDPRGIWSDGERLYALDSGKDALFAYELADGVLLAEHALDALNGSPRGLWSDGFTLWVSDDGANRVFAYRIVGGSLERLEAEEFGFRSLLKAGNGEARGIWSDGETLWVADAEDGDVNSYNLPDAVQAYLGSLSLSGLELGEFSPLRYAYEAALPSGVTETTVEATATQAAAAVAIEPVDADPETEGRQVSLAGLSEIAVTVTSADGSRTRVYRVALSRAQANRAPEARDIPALGLTAGGEAAALRLADYFSDPDGDALSYTVGASSAPGVARVEQLDDIVRVTPLRAGMARFRLSASDGELSTETRAVDVTVEAAPLAVELRIAARRLATGVVEFALQVRAEDGGWSERRLPRARFLPAGARAGRWLVSSALTVGEGEQRASVRIAARRVSGGRVEFALQAQSEDGTWGERRLPRARFLPARAALDRWLTSSPVLYE